MAPMVSEKEVPFALRVGDHDVIIESGEVSDAEPGKLKFVGIVPTNTFTSVFQRARVEEYQRRSGNPPKVDHEKEARRLKMILDALREKPTMLATVLAVDPARERCTISVGGGEAEVAMLLPLEVGQTVRVTGETSQITSVVENPFRAGNVVKVERVARPGLCEIENGGGTTRAVTFAGEVEAGDRLLLDQSGRVGLENLGKSPNDFVVSEPTGVSWDDVGGLEDAKREMREAISGPMRNKELYEKFGRKGVRGILLHGPAGCGKTMLGKAAATELAEVHGDASKGAFNYVKGPELLNMFVGNTEANIRRVFDAARSHKKRTGFPAIVFLDEADAVLGARGQQRPGGVSGMERTTVPQFLAEMDGLEDSGAIVVIATNLPTSLDPAVVRDGRIDRRIRVGRPTREDAAQILARALSKTLVAKGAVVDDLAAAATRKLFAKDLELFSGKLGERRIVLRLSDTVSGAMIVGVADRAAARAMRRALEGGKEGVGAEDLQAAVSAVYAEAKHVNHAEEIAELLEAPASVQGE